MDHLYYYIHIYSIINLFIQTNYEALGLTYDSQRFKVLLSLIPIFLGVLALYFWTIVRQLFDDFDKDGKNKVEDKPKDNNGSATLNVVLAVGENGRLQQQQINNIPTAPPKVVD